LNDKHFNLSTFSATLLESAYYCLLQQNHGPINLFYTDVYISVLKRTPYMNEMVAK